MGGMPNVTQEGKRPMPMLERQPPLPKATPMRLVVHEDDKDQEWTLVPIMPYANDMQYGQ